MLRFSPLAAGLTALIGSATAAPITENTFATFDQQTFGALPSEFTGGPREVGREEDSVVFTSSNTSAVFAYDSAYGLNDNGAWGGARRGFIGLNTSVGTVRFEFDRPVSGVGGFINYSPPGNTFGGALIRVLGEGNVVLEEVNLSADAPIDTENGLDEGAFRGFNRLSGDIIAFELSNAFIVIDNLTWSRDNVQEDVPEVPLPAAFPLFAAGLGTLVAYRRRGAKASQKAH